jgi:hypothetical protein
MKLLVTLAVLYAFWWWSQRRRTPALTVREARDLLGVAPSAGEPEIRDAHRRLIARVHPDAGGSAALAGRVNAARDLLVTELNRKGARAS